MRVRRLVTGSLFALVAAAGIEAVRAEATTISRVIRVKSSRAGAWFRVYRDGKWGYADRHGRMRLPARYDDVDDFFDGVAAVQVDGQWGYIDEQGTVVVPPRFEDAGPFQRGVALVRVDNQAGAIDVSGAFVIPPIYNDLFRSPDGDGVMGVRGDRYVVVGADGHEIVGRPFRRADAFTDGVAAVCVDPLDGPAFGFRGLQAESSCGYVDLAARFVVPPVYGQVEPFAGGVARVWDAGHHAFGLIRRDGSVVRGFDLEAVSRFSESLAFARDRVGAGYLKTDGTFAFRVDIREGSEFADGRAAVWLDGRYGFVDRDGRLVVRPRYEQARDFSEGLAPVSIDDRWGYIDRDGRLAIPTKFDDAEAFVDGLALVRTGGTWDYIDPQGRTIMHDVCDPEDVTPRTIC